MSLDSKVIVSLADVKAVLGNPPADQDPVLEHLINQTTALVEDYIGRTLISTAYTSLALDGPDRSQYLFLPNWPVTALTSVYEDEALLTLGSSADYLSYADDGIAYRVNRAWSSGKQNIVVTYTAGYTLATIPRSIQYLAFNKIAREWQKAKNSMWGQTSRSMGDGSASFEFPLSLTDDEKAILRAHRRVRI